MPRQKKYNTPHRSHVIKTRLDDDEYDLFQTQCKTYDISQAEMIRQSLTKLKIRPGKKDALMMRSTPFFY